MELPSGETTSTVITLPTAAATVRAEPCATAVPLTFMELILLDMAVGLITRLAVLAATWAGGGTDPVLHRSIQLPDVAGRIDHLSYDPKSKRLYMAALESGSVEVVDVEKGERVKRLTGLKEPQGVVFVPGMNRVLAACGGDGKVVAYDAGTLEEAGRVEVGEDADNVRLDAGGTAVLVGYASGMLAVLDVATLKTSGVVKLKHEPPLLFEDEFPASSVAVMSK